MACSGCQRFRCAGRRIVGRIPVGSRWPAAAADLGDRRRSVRGGVDRRRDPPVWTQLNLVEPVTRVAFTMVPSKSASMLAICSCGACCSCRSSRACRTLSWKSCCCWRISPISSSSRPACPGTSTSARLSLRAPPEVSAPCHSVATCRLPIWRRPVLVVGWPEGVSPSGSHRSRRDNLSSPGSCHPVRQNRARIRGLTASACPSNSSRKHAPG